METKLCTKCLRVKPLSEFHRNRSRPNGYHEQCKQCRNVDGRAYRAANGEKYNARARGYYARNYSRERSRATPEQARDSRLRRTYGITLDDYDEMLMAQGSGCAICGKAPDKNGRRLCVDHNHNTGRVRGLLCDGCNKALGNLQDSPELCRLAAQYLTLCEGQTTQVFAQEEVVEGEVVEVED